MTSLFDMVAARQNRARLSSGGQLFLAVFFVVLFEGAIRKWITADATSILVALRDGLAVCGIVWAFRCGRLKSNGPVLTALLLWSALVICWGGLQVLINQTSPLIFFVGLRFWLLYLWFACVVALTMTEHDFRVIIKTLMMSVIWLTPLIIIQFFSPPGAYVNRQIDGDEEKVFRLTADVVRTTGLFSFTLGQSTLLAMVAPFTLFAITARSRMSIGRWMKVAAFIALVICTMLSGSRSALATFGYLFLVFIGCEIMFSKRQKTLSTLVLISASAAVIAVIPLIFSSALEATTERIGSAAETEVLSDRIMTILLGEENARNGFSVIGYGLGAGTNFAGSLINENFSLGETETTRIFMEGGLLGMIFVVLKLVVAGGGCVKSLSIVRRTGNSMPVLVWFSLLSALVVWSIVGQLTVNALGFMLLGLGVAVLRPELAAK